MTTLQSRTGPVQGQNRVFHVKFSTQGKTCFHCRIPLFSLQGPLFSLQGFPCEKTSHGKPCSGPVLALYGIAVYLKLLKDYLIRDFLLLLDLFLEARALILKKNVGQNNDTKRTF